MLRWAWRKLIGSWVVEIDGTRVATFDSEGEARGEAARLGYVADGADVQARNVGGLFS